MKTNIPFCLAAALTLMVGCADDKIIETGADEEGVVNFVAQTTAETRLVYGTTSQDQTPIFWEADDKVYIYSPHSIIPHATYDAVADANGTISHTGSTHQTHLKPANEHRFIHWRNGGTSQKFYSFYSPDIVTVDRDTVFGTIPTFQNQDKPLMLLYAKAEANPSNPAPVRLVYKDILNTLNLTITQSGSKKVTGVLVESETQKLSGQLRANLYDKDKTYDFNIDSELNESNYFNTSDFVYQSEITDPTTSAAKATVSLLPNDYSGLKISVIVEEGNTSKITTFTQRKPIVKSSLSVIVLNLDDKDPNDWENYSGRSNWMSMLLNQDMLISRISIPGASDAGTNYNSFWDCGSTRAQGLSTAQMLKKGVRAFEFRCDEKFSSELEIFSSSFGIGGTRTTLKDQMRSITDFLTAFPTETVIVLTHWDDIGYRCGEMYLNYQRKQYIKSVQKFLKDNYGVQESDHHSNTLYNKIIFYQPGLTLRQCKGKILFLSPDPVYSDIEMGWDYRQKNGSPTNTQHNLAASGHEDGSKELHMLGSGKGSSGENLYLQLCRYLPTIEIPEYKSNPIFPYFPPLSDAHPKRTKKVSKFKDFLSEAINNKLPQGTWVINYAGATSQLSGLIPFYHYANFAENFYPEYIDRIEEMTSGATKYRGIGIIMMDYAGVDIMHFTHPMIPWADVYINPDEIFNILTKMKTNISYVNGDKLLKAVINNNAGVTVI